ncbi:MAG TPA: hypothetical protein VEL05_12335, partial [Candidatus Acidoferrum sp.]|nr:hypothetical protein [Candidatus Acidoferrum sp.]
MVVMVVAGCTLLAPAVARAQLPPPGPAVTIREVSRSSPIVAEVGSTVEAQYQGSFEVATPPPPVLTYSGAADDATFEFPYTKGHLRAIATSDIAGSSAAFDTFTAAGGNAIFDAADHIPSGASCGSFFTDACRTIFTTVATPDSTGLAAHPVEVFVETSNPANPGVLQPHLGSTLTVGEATILIDRIRAGIPLGGPGPGYVPALGGIDRSTLAIVESSVFIPPIAGVDRPIMIYVGALDGMLHAICAQVQGPCAALGQELWAFIPRTQLGALRLNE